MRIDQQRITKVKPFINKYNWKGINFPSEKDDQKKFEEKNLKIALNVLYAKKTICIYSTYVSKHNPNCEKQVIILMIPSGDGQHYLAVKQLSAFVVGRTSKQKGDFCCLNCLHSFRTKNKLKSHKDFKIFVT